MAATSNAIIEKFSSLRAVSLQTSDISVLNYTDDDVIQRFSYYQMVEKTADNLKPVCRRVLNDIHSHVVSNRTPLDILEMALHLQLPKDDNGTPVFVYHSVFPTAESRVKNAANAVPDVPFPAYVDPVQPQQQQQVVQQQNAAQVQGGAGFAALIPGAIGGAAQPQPQPAAHPANAAISLDQLKECSFVCAFLMRLINKTPDNVNTAWGSTMAPRFQKWFGRQLSINIPGMDWFMRIKNAIEEDKRLRLTWILTISNLDDIADQDSTEAGLNKYLAVTPLAYGGMQAQNLFMQAWHRTRISPDYILQEGYYPGTARTFEQIVQICVSYEPKSNMAANDALPAGQVTRRKRFRYARLFSPGYFHCLQAKESAQAIYLFMRLLSKVVNYGQNQDPNRIVVVASLGEDVKAVLDNIATSIFASQTSGNADSYSATALRAMNTHGAAAPAPNNPLQPVGQEMFV